MNMNTLFDPRTVVVVGAHAEAGHVGYALMQNLLGGGTTRRIIPVTEKFGEVFGIPTSATVSDVEVQADLALIAVSSSKVAGVLRECGTKGIPNVIVISAGFKEVGGEGVVMEQELRDIAEQYGITLLGPNCLGVLNPPAQLNASFAAGSTEAGHIAFLSQSGAIATALIDHAASEGIGFSKIVSLGNEASLSEIDLLEYLRDDEETHAILMYLEHISDGTRFMALVREITPLKPVVILRAGRSARGAGAVMSHTGSLAPDDAIFAAATTQSGAITVDTLRELFSFAKLFHMGIVRPLSRIAIVTNGGGPSVNTSDIVDLSRSLSLVSFDDATKESLRNVLPSMAAVGNPVDVIGDAGSARYHDVLDLLVSHDDIDAIIVIVTPQMMTDMAEIAGVVSAFSSQKPVIPAFMGGKLAEEGSAVLRLNGLVNFEFPTDAVTTLDLLAKNTTKHASPTVPAASTHTSLVLCDIHRTRNLLADYGMNLSGVFLEERSGIPSTLANLGTGPFALKAISKEVVHKSDAGAVAVNLSDDVAVLNAWDAIEARIHERYTGAHIDGMLLQTMVSGREVIIGMKRDRTFGPVILFGLGGIFVEIVKDVSMRIAPIDREEALIQIRSIKGARLLQGARGESPVNEGALADLIVGLSRLSLDHPEIAEIDLNPVMVSSEHAVIVDARFMERNS